jgi:hypothetical protein
MMQLCASSAKLRGSGTQSSQLCAPVLARHRNAGRMDDVNLDIACPQPARQTKAVAPSFIGDDDTLDVAPSLAGFSAPTMQQLQQSVLVGVEFLKWLAFDAGPAGRKKNYATAGAGDDRYGARRSSSPSATLRMVGRKVRMPKRANIALIL